jgi:MFS family permease
MTSTPPGTAVRRLAFARFISQTGTSAAFAALNFFVYRRTGSAAWLAATLLLTFDTSGLIGPLAGTLGDRFDRRRVMIVSDLIAAALFAAMAGLDALGPTVVVAFMAALAQTPFPAAAAAATPNLVPEPHLDRANGLLEVGSQAGFLIGPLIGGILVASFGARTVFACNAASFVASAALCGTVRGRFSGSRNAVQRRGVLAGAQWMLHDRLLRGITLAYLGTVLGLGITMVANVPLAERLGVGSVGYGALIAAWGAGSVAGAIAGRRLTRTTAPNAFMCGSAVVAFTALMAGVSPWFFGVVAALLVMGIGDGITAVAATGLLQRRSPDHVRSRVIASLNAVMNTGLACSYLAAALLVDVLGPRGSYIVGGLVAAAPLPFLVPTFWRSESPFAADAPGAGSRVIR